ncbi:MAG: hypothetical protein JNK87_17315 [Bryobacterales bacterium]|nr:hypothetical protein [Bryobacterales bacterium]
MPIEQILIGNVAIAASLNSIHQVNKQALVAIVISHFGGREDLQYTRKLEGAFAIARQRPASLILLGSRSGGAQLELAEIDVGSDAQDNNQERRRPSALHPKPLLVTALELLAKDSVWKTFVLVGHAETFLKLSAHTIPELFATLGRTRLCSGVEAEIVNVIRDNGCAGESQAPLLSVGVARLLVIRIPEFDASELEDPERILCAIENAGADAVWIAPWTAQ